MVLNYLIPQICGEEDTMSENNNTTTDDTTNNTANNTTTWSDVLRHPVVKATGKVMATAVVAGATTYLMGKFGLIPNCGGSGE